MGNLSGESSLTGALSIPTQMMPGTNNYNDLSNKPKLNGVTLRGDMSFDDVGIPHAYSQLSDKPSLNGHEIEGKMTLEDLGIKPGYDAVIDPTDDEHVILQF